MKKSILIPLLVLMPALAGAQELDQNFESWTPRAEASFDSNAIAPIDWSYSSHYGLKRSPDARSGSWAAIVHNWYHYISGVLFLGDGGDPGRDGMFLENTGIPVPAAPARMSGYYKYVLGEGIPVDSAMVLVMLKRYDSERKVADTLSFVKTVLHPADSYTPFEIAIPAPKGGSGPMELAVAFVSSSHGNCGHPTECYFLYLDDISFSTAAGVPLPVTGVSLPRATVAPNPVGDRAVLSFDARPDARHRALVFDMRGVEVRRSDFTGNRLDLETGDLAPGVYHVVVRDAGGDGVASGRFVVD